MHDLLQRTPHLAPDDLPLFSALLEDWTRQHYPKLEQTAEPWQARNDFHRSLNSAIQQALATAEWATHHGDPRPVTLNYNPVQHTLQVQLGDQIVQGAPGELPPTLAGHLFSPAGNAPVITLGLNSLRLLDGKNTEPLLYLLERGQEKVKSYSNHKYTRKKAINTLNAHKEDLLERGLRLLVCSLGLIVIFTPLVWGHPGPAYFATWVGLAFSIGLLGQAWFLTRYQQQVQRHLDWPDMHPLPHVPWPIRSLAVDPEDLVPTRSSLKDVLSLPASASLSTPELSQRDPKVSARLETLQQARKDLLELRQQAAAHTLPELAEIDRLLAQVSRMSAEQVQPSEQQLQDDVRQRTEVMKSFLNDLETN